MATPTPTSANLPAYISPVGPPPAINTARCHCHTPAGINTWPLHAIARCTPGVRPCAFVDGPFTEIDQEKSTPVAIVKEKIANDYWAGQILTRHAIGSTLDYMASIENSEVVFDYMEPAQAFSEEMRELVAERSERLGKIGERWASRFEPADMAAILRSHGFCDIEDTRSKFGHAVQGLALGYAGLHVVHAKH